MFPLRPACTVFNRKTTERQSNPFPSTITLHPYADSEREEGQVVCRLIKTNRPALMIDLKVSPAIPDIIKSCKDKKSFRSLQASPCFILCNTNRELQYVYRTIRCIILFNDRLLTYYTYNYKYVCVCIY